MRVDKNSSFIVIVTLLGFFSFMLSGCAATEQANLEKHETSSTKKKALSGAVSDKIELISLPALLLRDTTQVPAYKGAKLLFHKPLDDGSVLTMTRIMTTDEDVSRVRSFYNKEIPDFGNHSSSGGGLNAGQGTDDGPDYFIVDHAENNSQVTLHASSISPVGARPGIYPHGDTMIAVMTFLARDSAWDEAGPLKLPLRSLPAYSGGKYSGVDISGDDKLFREMQLMSSADKADQIATFFEHELPKMGWKQVGIATSTDNRTEDSRDFSMSFSQKGGRVHVQINRFREHTLTVLTAYTMTKN